MIYAGACYQSYFRDAVRDDDLLQLQSKQNALKYLREAVERSDGEVTDEMLMTIALLAIHGSVRQHHPRFTTPLYRDNEFYSSLRFDQTHLHALRSLVRQKGGLAELKLHGLSNIISMIDTFQSLMNLSKPELESLYSVESLVEQLQETWDNVARTRFAIQKDGFDFLDGYEGGSQLRQVICRIRILLETYALSLRKPRQVPDLMVAVHTRRSLQHAVLKLEPGEDCLHESARLATIIFLAELGWTLPVVGGFQARATKLLLDALNKCTHDQHWETHPEFLCWATVMGGLAARQTVRVQDFAAILRHGPVPWTKDSWIQVKALSLKFLPFEHELTGPCHTFWDNACDLHATEGMD
ncbi:hypothetical protein H2200_000620 [Cladophialophora chaetospira]|uniref:Uncharacterized protein n=1 Tax=Cladophialophora chaetospira TaxID=386627 RepID=A0AA39CQI4_9EURO|nr:hypothetical protein H2200_000620 [Cladophialophora chaetospira]